MEHRDSAEEASDDATKPLVYAAGVAGVLSLALGIYTGTQGATFATAMALVAGLVLTGGAILELRRS